MSNRHELWCRPLVGFKPAMCKAVLHYICCMADDVTDTCFPSMKTLASYACLSERKTRNHVEMLIGLGLVVRTHKYLPNGNQTSSDLKVVIVSQELLNEAFARQGGVTYTTGGGDVWVMGGVTYRSGEADL